MSTELERLAEDPDFYVDPPEGAHRVVDDRFCVVVGSERRWAGVCRLRLDRAAAPFQAALAEIAALVEGVRAVTWNVGSSSLPPSLQGRLRAHGLVDPDPPFDPVAATMILESEPPPPGGIETRRIQTFDDHLAGLEIMLASDDWSADDAAEQRSRARKTYELRAKKGASQWLALLEGRPVAFALAEPSPVGLYLAGGSTLPEARGNGCYRALVRARWEEAARLGLPGLAVQAQYGSSVPILRRLGFRETGVVHTLRGTPVPRAEA